MLLPHKDLVKRFRVPSLLVLAAPLLPPVKKLQILPFVIGGISRPSVS